MAVAPRAAATAGATHRRRAARPVDRRVHRRRVSRRRRPAGAGRRDRGAAAARDRRARPTSTSASRLPMIAASALPGHADRRRGRSSPRRRGARCSISCEPAASKASASTAAPAAVAAAGALVHYLRDTQKVDLAHVRAIGYRTARPTPAHRSDHAEAPRGRRRHRGRPRRARCSTRSIARSRRWAAGCCARGCCGRCSSLEPHPRSARRRRGAGVPHHRSRQVPRGAQGGPGPRAAGRARRARHRRPARSRRPEAVAGRRSRASGRCSPSCRRRSSARSSPSSTTWPTCATAIERTLIDEPPALARDGGFIRDGVDPELDELRTISRSGKQVIAEMEERERARTGIASLKVRYNRVFGYYIEISKSNLHAVPADYHRKQTIAGGERFITPALKEYEEKVLGADERILERELEIFEALRARGGRRGAAHPGDGARAGHARRAGRARRDGRGHQLHQAARARRRRAGRRRRPAPGRRAAHRVAGEPFVPNDITLNGTTSPARHPDRPEHGRQVDLPAADGAALR